MDPLDIANEIRHDVAKLTAKISQLARENIRLEKELLKFKKALGVAREYIGNSSSDELAIQTDINDALEEK